MMVFEISIISTCTSCKHLQNTRHLVMKHDLLSVSFAMDDMDEIFLRVLDNTWLFLFWNNIDIGE